ncbi:unnamed protein product [Clonostachys chloroleuca]|uniref:Homeobox and C2H2 transcription factor n=1 Tax=Clonostachys chloroleuca TaxID=1926264 RepID=A0AA35Q6E1_9HYPO|nr:unnamed protein product [Clonostachys chloroleuca]
MNPPNPQDQGQGDLYLTEQCYGSSTGDDCLLDSLAFDSDPFGDVRLDHLEAIGLGPQSLLTFDASQATLNPTFLEADQPWSYHEGNSADFVLDEHRPLPEVAGPSSQTQHGFTDVWQWLEGAEQPPHPCSHCKSKRLQCIILQKSAVNPNPLRSCTTCVALYRECSLAKGQKRPPSVFETQLPVYKQLHGVPEQEESGERQQPQPEQPILDEDGQRSSKHFVRKGARVLKEWFERNEDHPYPSEMERIALEQETGFSQKRISTWFSNARRRQKQRIQPVIRAKSPRPFDKDSEASNSTLGLTPFERWQASPPDEEPIPESVIRDALGSLKDESFFKDDSFADNISPRDKFTADDVVSRHHSVSSFDSGSHITSASSSSVWSCQSSRDSNFAYPVASARRRRRTSLKHERRDKEEGNLRFQCTFCTKSFKKKHDWVRHEKTIHLPQDSWICTPDLNSLRQRMVAGLDCPFCDARDSGPEHWEEHEFHICAMKPSSERLFTRKDHLWQHLRKFHGWSKGLPADLDKWQFSEGSVESRCGFCGCVMSDWTERASHLADHFKNGMRMAQWEGDWGLNESALSLLRGAVLPAQRATPNPILRPTS